MLKLETRKPVEYNGFRVFLFKVNVHLINDEFEKNIDEFFIEKNFRKHFNIVFGSTGFYLVLMKQDPKGFYFLFLMMGLSIRFEKF